MLPRCASLLQPSKMTVDFAVGPWFDFHKAVFFFLYLLVADFLRDMCVGEKSL